MDDDASPRPVFASAHPARARMYFATTGAVGSSIMTTVDDQRRLDPSAFTLMFQIGCSRYSSGCAADSSLREHSDTGNGHRADRRPEQTVHEIHRLRAFCCRRNVSIIHCGKRSGIGC